MQPVYVAFNQLQEATLGAYLYVSDARLNILSVFDDLRYDRSDADMLSPGMRRHIVEKLSYLGFKQISGNILENRSEDIRCIMPKSHALGASPFDITRYTKKREQDFYVLTPTQAACQFVDHYPIEEAVEKIKALVEKHPINLYRLMDYLELKPRHQDFLQAIPHLKYAQRVAVESEPLCYMRSLK